MTELDTLRALQTLAKINPVEWGPQAGEMVAAGLAADDPEHRLAALEIINPVIHPEFTNTVIEMLRHDPEATVKAQAAIALGPALEEFDLEGDEPYFDDDDAPALDKDRFEEILALLETAHNDPSNATIIRRRALEAAVRAPQPWLIEATRKAYQSGDRDWQITAVFCAGYLQDLESIILDALSSDDNEILFQAVVAAGDAFCEEGAPTLKRLARAETTDEDVRLAAIYALGHMPHGDVEHLLFELSRSKKKEIAGAADEALEELALMAGLDDLDEDYDDGLDDDF